LRVVITLLDITLLDMARRYLAVSAKRKANKVGSPARLAS
jgi:hypothetical protein